MQPAALDKLPTSFGLAGEELDCDARSPIAITGSADIWVLLSGHVDVFEVGRTGRAAGRRHHLMRLAPGAAIFGSLAGLERGPAEETPSALLAVGREGCRLLRLPGHTPPAGDATALAGLIDAWVAALSAVLAGPHAPARSEELQSAEKQRQLAPGTALVSGSVAWARVIDGTCRPVGLANVSRDAASPDFPLTPALWVDCLAETFLSIDNTEKLISVGRVWPALAEFQRIALQIVRSAAVVRHEADLEAEAHQDRLDNAAVGRALARVGQALDREPAAGYALARIDAGPDKPALDAARMQQSDDPLMLACGLIADVLGVAMRVPSRLDHSTPVSDRVSAIATASGMRFRRIRLSEGWWIGGAGPLLCFGAVDGRPYVALADDNARYHLVDGTTSRREPVTAGKAGQLLIDAIAFYPGFPRRHIDWRDMLRIVATMCRRDLRRMCWAGGIAALLGLAIPVAADLMISEAIPFADASQIVLLTVPMLAAAFGAAAFSYLRAVAVVRIETRSDAALQSAVWDHLLRLPAAFFRNHTAGDLADRAMGVSNMRQIITDITLNAVLAGIFSSANILLIFAYDAHLAVVAMLLTLGAAVPIVLGARTQLAQIRIFFRLRGRLNGIVLQFLRGIAKLRACHAERRAFALWADQFAVQQHAAVLGGAAATVGQTVGAGLPALAAIALFATVAYASPDLAVGSFVAVTSAFAQFLVAAVAVIAAIGNSLAIVPLYERLKPILNATPEAAEAGEDPGILRGQISIEHVSFGYTKGAALALQDVSLHAEAGEFIAIVGASGSGKSTLFRLLLGFEQPAVGSVRYDDRDLARLDMRAVRRQMGVIVQDAALLPGNIFANIVGSANLSLADAWKAAQMAGLAQDIRDMPMGMQTIIGEGMSTISGGQRQRLLIARALVRRPRLVLFDEATSALDNRAQAIVTESLEGLRATRIVIAHRLATVQKADRIYVLADGRVVETGRYEELMARNGHFFALARRQLA
jgi:NHLM bacteriocin system ABC transporter ATP-binding protein